MINQIISFTFSILLIRAISPEAFGIVGMVIPLLLFIKLLHSFGTTNSIISSTEINNMELSSILWGKAVFSIFISLVFILCIPLLTSFYSEEKISDVVIYFALSALISSVSEIYFGVLYRQMKYMRIAQIELFSMIFASVFALSIAFNGYDVTALITKEVVNSFLILLGLMIFSKWIPGLSFSKKHIARHAFYGMNVTIARIASWISRSLDDIIIGKFFSAQSLGIYTKAYSLLTLPNSFLVSISLKLGIPMIAKEKSMQTAIEIYKKIIRTIFLLNAPIGLILFFTCDIFVLDLFGEEWLKMIDLIKVFSLLSIFQVLGPLDNILYQGKNRVDKLSRLSIMLSGIIVISIISGYLFTKSILGIAIFYASATIVAYILSQKIISSTFGISHFKLIENLRFAFIGLFFSFILLCLIDYYLRPFFSGRIRYLYFIIIPVIYCTALSIVNFKELRSTYQFMYSFFSQEKIN